MSNLSTRLSDYIHDHSDKVALTLGLVVLALAVINFLWARRVKLLTGELAVARRVGAELTAAAKTRARIDSEAPVGLGRAVERDGRIVYTISQAPEQDAAATAAGGDGGDPADDGFVVRDPALGAPKRPVVAPSTGPTNGDAASWALSQQAAAEAASAPTTEPSPAATPSWSIADAEPVADPSAAGWSAGEQADPTPPTPTWGIRQPGEPAAPPPAPAPASHRDLEDVDGSAAYDDAWALRSAVRSQHELAAAASTPTPSAAPTGIEDDDADGDDEGSWGLAAVAAAEPAHLESSVTVEPVETVDVEPVGDATDAEDERVDEASTDRTEISAFAPADAAPTSSEGWGRPAFASLTPSQPGALPTVPAPAPPSEPATNERRHSRMAQLSWRSLQADDTAEHADAEVPTAQLDPSREPTPVVGGAGDEPSSEPPLLEAGGDDAYAAWDTATATPTDAQPAAQPSDTRAYDAWDAVTSTPEPLATAPAVTELPPPPATEPELTEPPALVASAPAADQETPSAQAPMRVVDWQLVDPTPTRSEATETPAVSARPCDILLVEDDENVGRVYRLLMESRGLGVRQAADGIEGLEQVRSRRPDLILLDVMMPRMNGILFLETLRDDPELRDLPVVVLSNFREQRLVDRAMGLGALEYMVKAQTRPEALLSAIPHWLRGERAARV